MDKSVVTKLPVTGQVNALLEAENELQEGDLIYVRIDIPGGGTNGNKVDIYCHAQSVRLAGVGDSPF